jgi:hypothetical protein
MYLIHNMDQTRYISYSMNLWLYSSLDYSIWEWREYFRNSIGERTDFMEKIGAILNFCCLCFLFFPNVMSLSYDIDITLLLSLCSETENSSKWQDSGRWPCTPCWLCKEWCIDKWAFFFLHLLKLDWIFCCNIVSLGSCNLSISSIF